ncbi:ATP-binding protein [Erwiniaceae bacterium L1_54_6]|nr:ATP-binding protein [Erwiniaceae bacterium L1_54_6]
MQKFELAIEQSQLGFHFDIELGIPLLDADMSMIERVLTNLVDNAIRHTPSGGMIKLRTWSQDQKVMLELEDSGPGISPAVSETLFERPSITDPNRRDNGGLGLVIVRRMLQLHQGDILLIEAPGACFRIFVPL